MDIEHWPQFLLYSLATPAFPFSRSPISLPSFLSTLYALPPTVTSQYRHTLGFSIVTFRLHLDIRNGQNKVFDPPTTTLSHMRLSPHSLLLHHRLPGWSVPVLIEGQPSTRASVSKSLISFRAGFLRVCLSVYLPRALTSPSTLAPSHQHLHVL